MGGFSLFMKKIYSATAAASATVANQPAFDRGGFPVQVREVLVGSAPSWETLADTVAIELELDPLHHGETSIVIENHTPETADPSPLPTDPEQHTAGRAILFALAHLKPTLSAVRLRVTKGLFR